MASKYRHLAELHGDNLSEVTVDMRRQGIARTQTWALKAAGQSLWPRP